MRIDEIKFKKKEPGERFNYKILNPVTYPAWKVVKNPYILRIY